MPCVAVAFGGIDDGMGGVAHKECECYHAVASFGTGEGVHVGGGDGVGAVVPAEAVAYVLLEAVAGGAAQCEVQYFGTAAVAVVNTEGVDGGGGVGAVVPAEAVAGGDDGVEGVGVDYGEV